MERTHEIVKVMIANKTSKSKGLWKQGFQSGDLISSQPRYDHFDTSPCQETRDATGKKQHHVMLFAKWVTYLLSLMENDKKVNSFFMFSSAVKQEIQLLRALFRQER